MNRVRESSERSQLTKETTEGILIHEKAEDMATLKTGAIVRLGNGSLFTVDGRPGEAFVSDDEGATWAPRAIAPLDQEMELAPTGALLRTADGVLILASSNLAERHFTWDDELKDAPGARLPTYVMRSLDDGETWQDVQKVHDEWTGANRDILQARDGRIVFTSMKMLSHPGRHSVLTYSSKDRGETWRPSNIIDLGGNGHHGGVSEATVVELKDGRLLKYIRTNWSQFWRALSDNGGRSWHPYGPSGVDASSAPGMLKRLASGRIALVWNRLNPEGQGEHPLKGGAGIWSATPVSNHREELSISFSEDECENWSPPVVIAMNPGGEASYPYIFEPEAGVLWITAHRFGLRMMVREEDMLR